MFKITNYYVAEDVKDAYNTLIKTKSNVILGGNMWLRLQDKNVHTAIDISKIGLNFIEEDDNSVKIGAMTTLSDIERSEILQENFGTLFKDMTHHIVGTQFRNTATVGGSIFGRFGFSDILTGILPLDAIVCTAKHGEIELVKFAEMPFEKDVLEYVKIPKRAQKICYKSFRNQATDFPVIAVCVCKCGDDTKISVGARPHKAKLVSTIDEAIALDFGTNMRASADYRRELTKILLTDAISEV
ncbi:MAG: FAD binding domain-containing protein [Clostridia bacterium]